MNKIGKNHSFYCLSKLLLLTIFNYEICGYLSAVVLLVYGINECAAHSHLHVLNHEVSSAEVDEAEQRVLVLELQVAQHLGQFQVSVILVDDIPVLLYDLETFNELLLAVLRNHVGLELGEFAPRNINHVLVVRVNGLLGELGVACLGVSLLLFLFLVVPILILCYGRLLREGTL